MSIGNLKKFKTLEILSVNLNGTQLAVLIVGLAIEFLILRIFLDKKKISSFFLGFYSLLLGPSDQCREYSTTSIKNRESNIVADDDDQNRHVCRDDVEVVLRRLGILSNHRELSSVPAKLDSDGILSIFDENNVSLGEVKDAFDVFDGNRDGFIDAKELQKVLCGLGMKEGSEMENCSRMIEAFDENGDGRIDFVEFLKLMENSF